jgi:hypothetical protein
MVTGLSLGQIMNIQRETDRALNTAKNNLSKQQIISRLKAHYLAKAIEEFSKQHHNESILSIQIHDINYIFKTKELEIKEKESLGVPA